MKRLTKKQAALFREMRPLTVKAVNAVKDIAQAVCLGCEHDDREENCPVCCLYAAFADAEEILGPAVGLMDSDLQRGPEPKKP